MPPLPPQTAEQFVRVGQIIVAALMLGVMFFEVVVLTITLGKPPPPQPLMAFVAAGFAGLLVLVRIVVPGQIVTSGCRRIEPAPDRSAVTAAQLYPLFHTKTIVEAALLEGAAFFNLVAYMIDRQWWTLGIVGGLLLGIGCSFPTLTRLEQWSSDRLAELNLERHTRPNA